MTKDARTKRTLVARGQGGPRSIFTFLLFLIEENVS